MKPVNQHIVPIGSVGKSTVGRLLARRLGWGFWDNDEALSRATGQRAPLYARLADITVDVAAEPATTWDRLIEALGPRMGLEDASRDQS